MNKDIGIHIEGLSKRYGEGATAVDALKEVNMSVAPGEVVGLIGPSGSGKTTLLKCLGAVIEPTQGCMTLDGEVIYDRDLILARCGERSRLVCDEVPYPAVGLRYYDAEDPVELANASVLNSPSKRSLVVSVFTQNPATFKAAAARLRAFKVVWNTPTSQLDLGASHQGMHLFLELMRAKEIHL